MPSVVSDEADVLASHAQEVAAHDDATKRRDGENSLVRGHCIENLYARHEQTQHGKPATTKTAHKIQVVRQTCARTVIHSLKNARMDTHKETAAYFGFVK